MKEKMGSNFYKSTSIILEAGATLRVLGIDRKIPETKNGSNKYSK